MQILLTIVLSFYPSLFLYTSIPTPWMKWIDGILPTGAGFFFVHLVVFLLIFALAYIVLSKYISLGYFSSRKGIVGMILMTVFALALALIALYNVLPQNTFYAAPQFLNDYLLKNPYTSIAFFVPWIYLFFD